MSSPTFSYWEKQHFFHADVLIVGSGIVGLTAAIHLKVTAPDLRILVLERGFLPAGASTKNAGFACFGSISELIEQENRVGTDGLHQLIAKRWNGLQKLRSLVGDENLAYQAYGGYELFKTEEDTLAHECVSKMEHYNTIVQDIIGTKAVYQRANEHIQTFGFKGISTLIKNEYEAQIDPGRMMRSLMQKAGALGISLLNHCNVSQIREQQQGLSIETPFGNFTAEQVLLTTNAFIRDLLPSIDVVPGRGQVLITKPITGLQLKGTFHYDKGYYYFRNVDNRILLGGGRNLDFEAEKTYEFGETLRVQEALFTLLKDIILPGTTFEIEQKWSGIMAFGNTLQPQIEEVKPGVFCAVRCNGMGIAMGSQTGEEAAQLVLDRR